MFCPNCGNQIPNTARVCGHCGFKQGVQFQQPFQQPPIQQPVPIIVQTTRSVGLFSGCDGLLNLVFSALVIGAIAFIVLAFLCIIQLPSEFPIIDLPAPVADLWSRAIDWQGGSCMNRNQTQAVKQTGGQNQGENAGATACHRSKFIRETIPDHTVYKPGEKFTKTWTVRNDGTCPWTTGYTFRFTQGSQLGGTKSITLNHEVKPGETYTFELDLTAPEQNGTYTGRWEIFDDKGSTFGWYSVVIDVGAGVQAPQPQDSEEVTVVVSPAEGSKCSNFSIAISGFTPNEALFLEIYSLNTPSEFFYPTADANGKAAFTWFADVTAGGQYIVSVTSNTKEGGLDTFIIEADDECTCAGVCPAAACSEANTQEKCDAAGGEWTVVRMQTGPNQYYCNCQ